MAFVQQHVREGAHGPEVTLSNNMCQDRHVEDLLLCIESWLLRKYGASNVQPWQIGSLDLSKNDLSDESVARIVERLRQLSVRVHSLDLSSNKAGNKGLSALEAYVWNCSEPFHEISLADNEITVEANADDNVVSSFLRCLYNHPSYPRKSSSDSTVMLHPLVLCLSGNKIADLSRLQKDIQKKVGQKARFCSSAEAYKADGEEFLSVYLAEHLQAKGEKVTVKDSKESKEEGDSAWQRRKKRRQEAEIATVEDDSEEEVATEIVSEGEEEEDKEIDEEEPKKSKKSKDSKTKSKKKSKKENGKAKKKKKRKSKKKSEEPEENGDASEDQEDAEVKNEDSTEAAAPNEDGEQLGEFGPLVQKFTPEDQARLKQDTEQKLRLMEGLLTSIGDSALVKLAELTVRLLMSGKMPNEMLSELKPFVGKQKASELTAWVETYCKSDWLKEKLSEAPESDEKSATGAIQKLCVA